MSRPAGLKKFVFVLILFLLFFLVLEGAARFLLSQRALYDRIFELDDGAYRIRWLNFRTLTTLHGYNQHSPTLGWKNQPGLDDWVIWGRRNLNTNSKGVRGKKEYSYAKPPGVLRIVTLGDSFTFGDEVGDEETYAAYLEKMIPNSEVINLGISGYGHDQMLIMFEEEGRKYHPDIVVVGFVFYDMDRNLRKFWFYAKPKFDLKNGRLALTGTPVATPEQVRKGEFFRLKIIDLLSMLYQKILWRAGINDRRRKELSEAILNELRTRAKKIGAETVFLYCPNEYDFVHFYDERSEREKYFFDFCERNAHHCTSVRPYFLTKIKKGIIMDTYGHWDQDGQHLAAEAVKDYLDEHGLLANP